MSSKNYIWKYLVVFLALLAMTAAFSRTDAAGRYTIYVNRKSNIVNVIDKEGNLVRSMYCSTGKNYSTIRGTYRIKEKYRWHALYHGVYGQYCTRIKGAYLFHSVPYKRPARNQLIIKDYNRLGTRASAGCVRLAVVDAKWIYDHCSRGSKVVIGETRSMVRPSRPKIKLPYRPKKGWDPTDPNSANPYYPRIAAKKGVSRVIPYGSEFDPLDYITVSSKVTKKALLLKNVSVNGRMNTRKARRVTLHYTLKDPSTLLEKSLDLTFSVKKKAAVKTTKEKTGDLTKNPENDKSDETDKNDKTDKSDKSDDTDKSVKNDKNDENGS